jgi:hypothetical protein
MKESDSIMAHLNEYVEEIISQLSAQGMTINNELKTLLLMSSVGRSITELRRKSKKL